MYLQLHRTGSEECLNQTGAQSCSLVTAFTSSVVQMWPWKALNFIKPLNFSGWKVHKKKRVIGHRMAHTLVPIGIDLHWSRCLGPVLKKSQRIRFAPNGRQRNSICLPTSEMAMQSRHRHPCRKCLHHLHHHVQIIQLRTLRTSSIGCVPTLGTRIG